MLICLTGLESGESGHNIYIYNYIYIFFAQLQVNVHTNTAYTLKTFNEVNFLTEKIPVHWIFSLKCSMLSPIKTGDITEKG